MSQSSTMRAVKRRDVLRGAAALAAAGTVVLTLRPARATPEKTAEVMGKLIGGKTAKEGRVTLTMPQIAENGNTVPLTVSVESPMTEKDYVKAVHILADGNPEPAVATFGFTPQIGKAEISTRMRMAKTQNIWAVAEMSDGSAWMTKTEVKVTIGGCGG
nr:thiosulfate oxidation carrier protein SoxY [Indioceanicola profundi]